MSAALQSGLLPDTLLASARDSATDLASRLTLPQIHQIVRHCVPACNRVRVIPLPCRGNRGGELELELKEAGFVIRSSVKVQRVWLLVRVAFSLVALYKARQTTSFDGRTSSVSHL